jgi:DNA invertase Pin-like site-specific DNA recombinase
MTKPFGKSDEMKKATPFLYARISTDEQSVQDGKINDVFKKTAIKRQIKLIQDLLKSQGLPKVKKENIYAEVASGRKSDRPQWLAIQSAIMAHNGPAFIVIKSPSRWARELDSAVEAWAPLKRKNTPVYAIFDNIQTGHAGDLRPQESLWFLLNSGFAALGSDEQKVKADQGVKRQKAEGALAGTGSSLYPFARRDPLEVFLENEDLLTIPKGKKKFAELIEVQSMPNGMKAVSVNSLRLKVNSLREKLNAQQFKQWLAFRAYLRNKLIELDSDPWVGKLAISSGSKANYYPARALMRMAGLYLTKPAEHLQPKIEVLETVIKEFPQYLSDKDKKRRGKR